MLEYGRTLLHEPYALDIFAQRPLLALWLSGIQKKKCQQEYINNWDFKVPHIKGLKKRSQLQKSDSFCSHSLGSRLSDLFEEIRNRN